MNNPIKIKHLFWFIIAVAVIFGIYTGIVRIYQNGEEEGKKLIQEKYNTGWIDVCIQDYHANVIHFSNESIAGACEPENNKN